MTAKNLLPDPETLIPDLLRAAPQSREVLDRYGLRGCGGPLGPHETLKFFARAHDVPLDQLCREIGAALESEKPRTSQPAAPAPLPIVAINGVSPLEALADSIYRPFFRAGIAVVLTLGAAWGVVLLLRIAISGSFTTASLHEVNAHGHAQIFGWVGLFVMGFAYQAFPRFKHTNLKHPALARRTLWLMLVGLTCRSILEPFAATQHWLAAPAVLASVLEIIAIGIFVWLIASTLRGAKKRLEFYDAYIFVALAAFFIQAVYQTIYFAATIQAADQAALLNLVATWQGPLRNLQIHGFAMMIILGVSQRMVHHFYDLPAPHARRSLIALAGLVLAISGEIAGFLLMRMAGFAWAALWYSSVVLLFISAAYLVSDWHLFARTQDSDRSLKFLRAAYVWLFISLGMLVMLPVYQIVILPRFAPNSLAASIGFSHAYHGAARHAIAVGFISLMIMGVAGRVVPTLTGADIRKLNKLWVPFLLVNVGCTLRVSMQALTDFTPSAYPIAGISGLLELTGLAIWGVSLLRLMRSRRAVPAFAENPRGAAVKYAGPIGADSIVANVIEQYPWLLETFVASGFEPLRNIVIRNTVAKRTTIAQACRRQGVDEAGLLELLNKQRIQPTTCPTCDSELPLVMPPGGQQNAQAKL